MNAHRREPSTRAKVVRELLDTPAVQEILQAHAAPRNQSGAIEEAVRKDPELALGMAIASIDRFNEALHSVAAVLGLVGSMPAPLVRQMLENAWSRFDRDAIAELRASLEKLSQRHVVDRDAAASWLSDQLEALLLSVPRSTLLASSTQLVFDAYVQALRRDPQLLRKSMERALERVPSKVLETTVDSSLDQVADVLLARPRLLRSVGRFVLRLGRGSVRASFS